VVVFAAKMVVRFAMFVEMQVGLRFVNDYLMAVVEVEIAVTGRKFVGESPAVLIQVNKLVIRDIIIALDVGDVVIVDVIVAGGPPGGLDADVDGKMDLGACRVGEGDAAENGPCQEKIFHTF
jgi:hypothetical protein